MQSPDVKATDPNVTPAKIAEPTENKAPAATEPAPTMQPEAKTV